MHCTMRSMLLSATLAFALVASAQAAQIYRWVDAQGVTHFDATPPAGQQTQEVDIQRAPLPGSVTPPPPAPVDAQQSAIDARVRQQVSKDEAWRTTNCEALRTNLAQLKNNPRIRESTEDGLKRLSEEDRQARIVETGKMIAQYCD